ncbi:MAG: polysaccharide deacetylase family protein [Clostridiales bacterium]
MKIISIIGILILLILSYSLIPTGILKIIYFGKVLKKQKRKNIYLTFDDGPTAEYTPLILSLLKEYNIKACFFMVSNFAQENPDIVSRIKDEGHTIGLHSSEHKNALLRGYGYMKKDFKTSINTMEKLGVKPHYYRPPWGDFNLCSLYFIKKYKLKLVLWQVMAEDWSIKATPDTIKEKLLKRTKPGSIICLHDGRGAEDSPLKTYWALQYAIPALLAQGYTFKSLDKYYEKRTLS